MWMCPPEIRFRESVKKIKVALEHSAARLQGSTEINYYIKILKRNNKYPYVNKDI
jgi:hypothetical protein